MSGSELIFDKLVPQKLSSPGKLLISRKLSIPRKLSISRKLIDKIRKKSKNETNLDIDLVSLVQDQVHVLVETNDDALEANIDDIVQPDLEN